MSAASRLPAGSPKAPTPVNTGASDVFQESFSVTLAPLPSKISNFGSASVPSTPNAASPGPTARMSSGLGPPVPEILKPAIRMSSPVPTRLRAETLTSRAAEGAPVS